MRSRLLLPVAAALAVLGAACSEAAGMTAPSPNGTASAAATPPALVALSAGATPAPGVARLLVSDLAARLGVPPAEVTLTGFEARHWPNGCLGLARAGEVCSQAFVSGWLATLRTADGREFCYRGAGNRFILEPPVP